ncbi:MAG TPA: HAD family hydrolase [Pyrinomonadaceae bacterium]|jgi:putative hydrolase of the HAD superfamily
MEQPMLHPSLNGARACVFDVGGTLVHPDWPRLAALAEEVAGSRFSDEEMRRAFGEMLKTVGAEVQRSNAPAAVERGAHWTFRGMYGCLGLDPDACESLVGRIDRAHAERHIWCGADPEAAPVIEGLRRAGLLVAVISNTEDGRLKDSLAAAGLADKFDLMVDSHVVGLRKPDPAVFRHALERLGVEAAEAAFVGDSYAHDALAARAAGMRAVLLDPLDMHPEAVCPRIRRLGDLLPREV